MSSSAASIIECRGLHKAYDDGTRMLQVLRGADLDVREGEIISIVGASGAGKSTLLHLLGALDRPNRTRAALNSAGVNLPRLALPS
jgi:lipoprotein-releasing system ATP-binding protein